MAGTSPVRTRGALGAGLLAATVGLVVFVALRDPPPDAVPESDATTAVAPPPTPDPVPAPTPATEPPRLDVVRVAPDGAAVVAGRAEPGAQVTISGDDGPLAEATADAAGEFVAVFDAPPADAPQALRLEAEGADGVTTASPDVVVLVPPAPSTTETAPDTRAATAVADAEDEPAAEDPEPATVAAADAAPAAPADASRAGPEVAATVVLRGDGAEATPTGAALDGLNLASISYAETGLVTLAGSGDAGARIRAYVDDRFAQDGAIGADGRWTLELGDVDAGVYRLRIDALREDGTVVSRIETPFQRDFPSAPPADGGVGPRPSTITVQPGNNLWTLARVHYGSGVLYTQIYTANRDLIRDPELIYPGQIFVLPETAPAE